MRTARGFSEMNRTGLLQPEQLGIPFPENTRNTFLKDRLILGADARFQTARSPKSPDAERRYFPMQASAYSAYRIFEWLSTEASYNFGPKKYPGQQKWTASAIIQPGGFPGSIRAGFFQPSIGLRYDDHTVLARRFAGADGVSLIPPHYAEYGAEINYSRIPWLSATAGVFSGKSLSENRVIDRNGEEAPLIRNRDTPSALARLELFHPLEGNLTSIMGGGSVLVNDDFNMENVFLGTGLFGNVSIIAEYVHTEKSDYQRTDNGTLDVGYRLIPALTLSLRAERGVTRFSRSTGEGDGYINQGVLGAQIFLLPHFELRPEYRLIDTEYYRATRYAVQMHLFY
ncbi:MAG: hypothetical protein ACYC9O_01750 [Candidatus Latescibacterota bacterium]